MSKLLALLIHCLILAAGFFAIYTFVFRVEPNKCEMTYMFEMPKYIKVNLDTKKLYPKYNLYYYTEGDRGLSFDGVPALFIPGNAGSHKQARSVGSVALRMAESLNVKKFDFFALDFDEELSALSGSLLRRQTAFTSHCIKHILALYKGRSASLAIVGHSMGGVIARALFSLDEFDQSSISVVITQAAPHERPVLLLDETMGQYYKSTNDAWRKMSDRIYADLLEGREAPRVTLVSTGGGDRDHMVRTDLTGLSWIGSHHHAIWTSTVSMPKAWVSTDHLCHVWCKQVVMATVRALYDIIDPVTKQVSTNGTHRNEVMKYHFLTNHGDGFYSPPPPTGSMKVNPGFGWTVVKAPWMHQRKASRSKNVVVDVAGIRDGSEIVIMSDVVNSNWIGACAPDVASKPCIHLDPLSSNGFLLPNSRGSPYKVVHLSSEELKVHKFIVLVLPASAYTLALVDVFQPGERSLSFESTSSSPPPPPSSSSSSPPSSSSSMPSPSSSSVLWFWQQHEAFLRGPSYHSLTLMDLGHHDAYEVEVESLQCEPGNEASSVVMFEDERQEYPTYSSIRIDQVTVMQLKLVSKGSTLPRKLKEKIPGFPKPKVKLYLTSNCTFRVVVRPSVVGIFGQVARFYLPYLPAFVTAAVVLRLGGQYSRRGSHTLYSIPIVSFITITLASNFVGLDQLLGSRHDLTIQEHRDWLPLLLLFLFAMSLSQLLLLTTSLTCVILRGILLSTRILDFLNRLVFLLLVLSSLISYFTCGSVGLLMAQIFCLTTVARHKSRVGTESPKPFLSSVFLVSLLHFLINFPTLIIWVKDVHNFHLLESDPSFVHSCVSSVTLCWLKSSGYLCGRPRHQSTFVWLVILTMTPTVILYGTVSLYRISYFLDAVLLLLTLHSLVSLFKDLARRGRKADADNDVWVALHRKND